MQTSLTQTKAKIFSIDFLLFKALQLWQIIFQIIYQIKCYILAAVV